MNVVQHFYLTTIPLILKLKLCRCENIYIFFFVHSDVLVGTGERIFFLFSILSNKSCITNVSDCAFQFIPQWIEKGQSDLGYSTRWKVDPRCTMATLKCTSSNLLHRSTSPPDEGTPPQPPSLKPWPTVPYFTHDETNVKLPNHTWSKATTRGSFSFTSSGWGANLWQRAADFLGQESRVRSRVIREPRSKMSWLIEPFRLISGLTWLLLVKTDQYTTNYREKKCITIN